MLKSASLCSRKYLDSYCSLQLRYASGYNCCSFRFQVAGTDHPALFTATVFVEPIYWIHSPPSQLYTKGQLECQFRFQNTSPLVPCVITTHEDNPWHRSVSQNNMVVSLAEPLRAVTPGQVRLLKYFIIWLSV